MKENLYIWSCFIIRDNTKCEIKIKLQLKRGPSHHTPRPRPSEKYSEKLLIFFFFFYLDGSGYLSCAHSELINSEITL
jgi:hypothetical protein